MLDVCMRPQKWKEINMLKGLSKIFPIGGQREGRYYEEDQENQEKDKDAWMMYSPL